MFLLFLLCPLAYAWRFSLSLVAFLAVAWIPILSQAADVGPSVHSLIMEYAQSIEAVNASYAEHLKTRGHIAEHVEQIYQQFTSVEQESQVVNSQAQAEFQQWLAAYSQRALSGAEVTRSEAANAGRNFNVEAASTITRARQNYAQQVASEMNVAQRVNQTRLAQSLNEQRRVRLQLELGKLDERTRAWSLHELQLVRDYLAQADILNLRSDLELRSAKRLLKRELEDHPQNIGARLALAITLLRLNEASSAQSLLDAMIKEEGVAVPFARAARAELLSQSSDPQLARRDLSMLRNLKAPELLVFQARTLTNLREFKQAEELWQTLTKTTEYEVVAHCQIALSLSSRSQNEAQMKRALDEVQLAVDLSGGDDWHCHLTHAICLAATKEKDAAIIASSRAIELAIGNKKQLCTEIADKIKLDQAVSWQY